MSTPPTDPSVPPRKELTNALVWVLASLLLAVGALAVAAGQDEKRTFYILVGALAVIATVVNGYAAWVAYHKGRTPPPA